MSRTKMIDRSARRLALSSAMTLLPAFAVLAPSTAKADGVVLRNAAGGFQDQWLVHPDPTFGNYKPWGACSNRANVWEVDERVEVTASASDVHVYFFDENRKHADHAANSTSDLGGDGHNFQGGIEALRCAKGSTCGWTLGGWANLGKSLIVQREFYTNTLNNHGTYLPFVANSFGIDPGGGCPDSPSTSTRRLGLADQLKLAIDTAILNSPQIQSVADETVSVTWETGQAMCTRLGLTTGSICGDSSGGKFADLLRLHFDARITPKVNQTCSTAAKIANVATFGLFFGTFNYACKTLTGSYRATADVWLQPSEGTTNNFYQFQVAQIAAYYSVNAYSGVGATTLKDQLVASFEASNPAVMLRNGFLMKTGQALCCHPNPSDPTWAATCTQDGVNENDLTGGVSFFRTFRPNRVQLSLDIDNNTSGPAATYFQPLNNLAAEGHTGLLDLENVR